MLQTSLFTMRNTTLQNSSYTESSIANNKSSMKIGMAKTMIKIVRADGSSGAGARVLIPLLFL
jgi:hypothetical protein